MAGAHQQPGVGPQERLLHVHHGPVRQHGPGVGAQGLDEAEDIVPAAQVQARGPGAVLVKDLLHLEGRRQGLDEHGGADAVGRQVQILFHRFQHLVPPPGFQVVLKLGQIQVGTRAPLDELPGVVEQEQPHVEQAGGNRLAGHLQVARGRTMRVATWAFSS